MKITGEIEMAIANDSPSIKSIEVEYPGGINISGFVKRATFLPFIVTLCKHSVLKDEYPYHDVEFNKASKITLNYHSGEVKVFE